MTSIQGDLALLDHPIAQDLLTAPIPARLAYVWLDNTPRVVPIWFHWDGHGRELYFDSPIAAPKVKALRANSSVAVTIDREQPPYHSLTVRGHARLEVRDGLSAEYAAAARRYYGEQEGDAWVAQASSLGLTVAHIAVKPEWVGLLDFEERLPSALERALEAAQGRSS